MSFYGHVDEAISTLKQARSEAEAVGRSAAKKDNELITTIQEKLRKAAVLAMDASKDLHKMTR